MKCPKCGYLGFESGDRCRNCGYEFSLSPSALDGPELTLDREVEQARPSLDLDRLIGVPESVATPADLPLFSPPRADVPAQTDVEERRTFTRRADRPGGRRHPSDDAPLITAPVRPRAPLGVRRATAEVPRARPRTTKPAAPLADTLFETPAMALGGPAFDERHDGEGGTLATPSRRITAALVDATLLSALDALVLYFTLRLCGLGAAEILQLPVLPLAAFLLLLNGGYFIAFTTVGGQSIGKMALGIKVIAQEDGSVPIGRATIRTLAYVISALPLGAGFLPGLMSSDRLALHDRLAHTRVVRPSSPLL